MPQHCPPGEIRTKAALESYFYREALHCHSLNLDDANLFSMHPKVTGLVLKLREIDREKGGV
jgi:hypothetical protein